MESLAIMERGYLFPSPASFYGVKSQCPFCMARHISDYRAKDLAIILQGPDSGRIIRYFSSDRSENVDRFVWVDEVGICYDLQRDLQLTLPLEALTPALWLPNLPIRQAFVIDELATWFCNEGMVGGVFHWDDDRLLEVIRTIWRKRIPITPKELSKIFLAHGLSEMYQNELEDKFDFGLRVLVESVGRKPLHKLRNEEPVSQRLFTLWQMYQEIDHPSENGHWPPQ